MSVSTTPTADNLLPPLADPSDREAIRFEDCGLTYRELTGLAIHLAGLLEAKPRVAVWAVPTPETCAAVVGALVAGVPVVPINPKAGERELTHIVADSSPALLLAAKDIELPSQLAGLARVDIDLSARGGTLPAEPSPEAPALENPPGPTALAGLRLLLVDDAEDTRECVALMLRRRGADAEFTASKAAATRAP